MKKALDETATNAYIDLTFGPTWPYVRVVREFIESFCRVSFGDLGDDDTPERISSSASELVENAVKYSIKDDPQHGTHVRVELLQQDGTVILEVQNRAQQKHFRVLQDHLFRLQAMNQEDLQQAYRDKMVQAAEDGTTSQLGLLRILWEWRAEKLTLDIIEVKGISPKVEKVSVKAYFRLGRMGDE